MEVEPNDNRAQSTFVKAPLPVAFNGIINKDGDHDWFKFTAKKRTTSCEINGSMDPVINLYGPDNKQITANDDADNKQDSKIDFTAAVDGEFT